MKIWANSADSHVLEPIPGIWDDMPEAMRQRAPSYRYVDGREQVVIDGEVTSSQPLGFEEMMRPPGALDLKARLADLDEQGVWREIIFPSRGMWIGVVQAADLARAMARSYNGWCASEVITASPRFLPAALLPVVEVADAVAELQRAAELGFKALFMPASSPEHRLYNNPEWEPLWAAAEECGLPLCFHIGTGKNNKPVGNPGGVLINYLETYFPGQRTIAHLCAAGVLDRHPGLRVFIAEAGASWVPGLADRLDEMYKTQPMFVRPMLSDLPSTFIYNQVYTSFQHDRSTLPVVAHMGYDKVMWGSDYPHLEGTYPWTQKILGEIFEGVDEPVRQRLTDGAFTELFGPGEPLPR